MTTFDIENYPVDVISRGREAKDNLYCNIWFCCPKRLRDKMQTSIQKIWKIIVSLKSELKSVQDVNFAVLTENSMYNCLFILIHFFLLIRIISYMFLDL